MKYYVTYAIDGRYVAEVDAKDLPESCIKAYYEYVDADFGPLEIVDNELVYIEDEFGNCLLEK